ncbi:MAG: hypothetical protein R3B95_10030 [Nitrospirales bacterium]|nr:hypothetical protein [Nitrospirales bacterium]
MKHAWFDDSAKAHLAETGKATVIDDREMFYHSHRLHYSLVMEAGFQRDSGKNLRVVLIHAFVPLSIFAEPLHYTGCLALFEETY